MGNTISVIRAALSRPLTIPAFLLLWSLRPRCHGCGRSWSLECGIFPHSLISASWFDNVSLGAESKLLSASEMPGSTLANRRLSFLTVEKLVANEFYPRPQNPPVTIWAILRSLMSCPTSIIGADAGVFLSELLAKYCLIGGASAGAGAGANVGTLGAAA